MRGSYCAVLAFLAACGGWDLDYSGTTYKCPDGQCPAGFACDATKVCRSTSATPGTSGGCQQDQDCGGGGLKCIDRTCKTPAASCSNSMKDGTETDLNCGGADCGACADGKHCGAPRDCISGNCAGTPATCQVPTCSDVVQNGGESGVDCGGTSTCRRCNVGEGCHSASDCQTSLCGSDGKCAQAPPAGPCDGVTCPAQATCKIDGTSPVCLCAVGYEMQSNTCVTTPMTRLLMHFDAEGTPETLSCGSGPVTRVGNVYQGDQYIASCGWPLQLMGDGHLEWTTAMALGLSEFTIDFVMKSDVTQATEAGVMLAQGQSATDYWAVYVDASPSLTFEVKKGGVQLVSLSKSIANWTWRHVAVIRKDDSFAMYFDGSRVASAQAAGAMPSGTKLTIGGDALSLGLGDDVRGWIDEVRIRKQARCLPSAGSCAAPTLPFSGCN